MTPILQSQSFPIYSQPIPTISTPQMIEVDRLMMEKYGIQLLQMMENAGRALALVANDHMQSVKGQKVLVLTGTGGNGGGAMVCARRLAGWGFQVTVCISSIEQLEGVPKLQYTILTQMGVALQTIDELDASEPFDLIIDGIIGYSIQGSPRGNGRKMIEWTLKHNNTPVISLDTPSGLDLNSGVIHHPAVNASATLTLALPKHGLFSKDALSIRGRLFLADISVPKTLYTEPLLSLEIPQIFRESDIIEIV